MVTTCVIGIYTASHAAGEMLPLAEARLEAGRGIVGDRYYNGNGTFSDKTDETGDHEVTLIESEEIDRFNRAHGLSLDYRAFRRNIVTEGVGLNDLVGREFLLGEVRLYGVGLCEPCAWLARILVPEVLPGLVGRGGLRGRIVVGGRIGVGEEINVERVSERKASR